MQYFRAIDEYKPEGPAAVTVGKFDGIHLGHRLLTEELVQKKKEGMTSVVVTFDIQPTVRTEHKDIRLLVTPGEKRLLMKTAGVDVLLELTFSDEFMHMAPETFIRMLKERLRMEYLVVGSDFHYGYRGKGDITLLRMLADREGFSLCVMKKKQQNQRDISSTYVREEISRGNITAANELLGYPYYLIGNIVHGNHIGSTKLSYPTINILPPPEKLLPPNGVYITEVEFEGRTYKGITNVGIRPTVAEAEKKISVETHILDFRADIYEKTAKILFLDFIRREQAFESFDDLKRQIAADVKQAYRFFNS